MGSMRDILDWVEGSLTALDALSLEEELGKEYLDPKNVNLLSVYQDLNRLLFDGKLGIYTMKWNRRKRSGALVKYKRIKSSTADVTHVHSKRDLEKLFSAPIGMPSKKATVELKITSIEVSTFMAFTMQALRNRLAHEMIHVYWLEKGIEYGHGRHFKSEMRRINSMNKGITVTLKEGWQDPDLAFKGGKRQGVIIFSKKGIVQGITVFSEKNNGKDRFVDAILSLLPKYDFNLDWKWEFYVHDAPWFAEYRVARPPKGKFPGYARIGPLRLKEIRDKGIYLGTISNDGVSWGMR